MTEPLRLSIELGALKSCWSAWCGRRGLTSGEGVRRLILDAIRDEGAAQDATVVSDVVKRSVDGPRVSVEIRLTVSELAAVKERATVVSLSANRWIALLVRAHVAREPQFGLREMSVLAQSTQQLAELNRLLRERARCLGEQQTLARMPDWASVQALIDAHLRATSAVIRANLDRWSC